MIAARRLQRHFADGFLAEAVEDLWEPWMRHADTALEDDALLLIIQQEFGQTLQEEQDPWPKSDATEVVLRNVAIEACARLELRNAFAGSAG